MWKGTKGIETSRHKATRTAAATGRRWRTYQPRAQRYSRGLIAATAV